MKELETMRENYKSACVAYIRAFEKKQGIDFDGWVLQEVGGIACFGDYTFAFLDVVHDIDTRQPKGRILQWYSDCLDNAPKRINYRSYCMGLRFGDVK